MVGDVLYIAIYGRLIPSVQGEGKEEGRGRTDGEVRYVETVRGLCDVSAMASEASELHQVMYSLSPYMVK